MFRAPGNLHGEYQVNKAFLSMDNKDPFTGSQTPVSTVDGDKKAILFQENLGLKENLDYNGRIVLKATSGIEKALVTLKMG